MTNPTFALEKLDKILKDSKNHKVESKFALTKWDELKYQIFSQTEVPVFDITGDTMDDLKCLYKYENAYESAIKELQKIIISTPKIDIPEVKETPVDSKMESPRVWNYEFKCPYRHRYEYDITNVLKTKIDN